MFEVFAKYLRDNASLTDDEIEQVRAHVTERKLRKRQYLVQEGEVSRYNTFVARGCLRWYTVSSDGTEHILRFAIENWWINDYESYHSGTPAKGNVDALEDSEILMIAKDDFEALQKAIPKFNDFIEKLSTRSYDASQKRILSIISGTAEERYDNFIKAYPGFFSRVPLRMIASYLGLTRETLSRIRSKQTLQ